MQAQAPASSTSNQRTRRLFLLEKPQNSLKMLRNAGLADRNGGMADVFLSVSTVFAETICTRGVKKEDT